MLEAVRDCDGPPDQSSHETDTSREAVKLGRTTTVAAQIERYAVLARRNIDMSSQELAGLFALISRRPDARLLFADAGRRAGRHASRRTSFFLRLLNRNLPSGLRDRFGGYLVRRAAGRFFHIDVMPSCRSASTQNECPGSLSPEGRACGIYGSGLAELLRSFTSFDGACFLPSCRARGGGGSDGCRWSTVKEEED